MCDAIENAFIEFHNDVDPTLLGIDFMKKSKHFGVLHIKIKKTEITKTPVLFLFTIDNSGSMDDFIFGKNSSKMNYVKQTFKNMLRFFSEQNASIFIKVLLFNDNITTLIDTIEVTKDNYKTISDEIMKVHPSGYTNIEGALKTTKTCMQQHKELYPSHKLVHVFMSDGDANVGMTQGDKLADLICTDYYNVFIGFGDMHNAVLLKKFGQYKGCDYLFVNNMEASSLIYGEIIHKFLYSTIENPTIRLKNAFIYNWKTNEWLSEIEEDVFVSETERIYHIVSNLSPELVEGEIVDSSNNIIDTLSCLPELLCNVENKIINNNLAKYMFRQEVLVLLFQASNGKKSKKTLKNALNTLFLRIQQYMSERELKNDSFMRLLCDDLSVTYKTLGKRDGIMYASARQGSQGNQRSVSTPYRNTESRDTSSQNIFTPSILKRGDSRAYNSHFHIDSDNDSDLDEHEHNDQIYNNLLSQTFDEDDNNPSFPTVLSDTTIIVNEIKDFYKNLDEYNESNETTCCYATQSAMDTLTQIGTNI